MTNDPAAQQPSAQPPPGAPSSEPGRTYDDFPVEEVEFPMQANEDVLAVIRRHPFFLWPRTVFWAVLAIGGPALLYWVLSIFNIDDDLGTVFWIVAGVWFLFWAVRTALNYYVYQNDIWVITNQRILDSRKATPINHKLATADLVNLQDITVHKRGIFASVLGFGDVSCETATARDAFVLAGISRPVEVQSLIDRERDRERMRRS